MKQAVETLLPMWAEVEMDDALELLGPGEGFRDRRVRAYAVLQLGKADDDVSFSTPASYRDADATTQELMLYLLQLVQALKFETPVPTPPSSYPSASTASIRSYRSTTASSLVPRNPIDNLPTLEDFLVDRSARNAVLGNHFHWYIAVECEDKRCGKMYKGIAEKFQRRVAEVCLPFVLLGRRKLTSL